MAASTRSFLCFSNYATGPTFIFFRPKRKKMQIKSHSRIQKTTFVYWTNVVFLVTGQYSLPALLSWLRFSFSLRFAVFFLMMEEMITQITK